MFQHTSQFTPRPPMFVNPTTREEAMAKINTLKEEIHSIKTQLQIRRESFTPDARIWRNKAQTALAAKMQQLHYVQNWLSCGGQSGVQKAPTMSDQISDDLCATLLRFANFKKKSYNNYRVAKAALHLLTTHPEIVEEYPETDEVILWLERSGFQISHLKPHQIEDEIDMPSEQLTENTANPDEIEADFED